MNNAAESVVHNGARVNKAALYDEVLAELAETLRTRREARDKLGHGTAHDAMQQRIVLMQFAYDLMVKHKYGECR